MRITCPACAAVYEIPEPLLGSRDRILRCGHCAAEWVVAAPKSESVAEAEGARASSSAALMRTAREDPEIVVPAPTVTGPASPSTLQPKDLRERPFVLGAEPARPSMPRREGSGGGGAWLAWLASLIVLGLLVWGAYAYRGVIMQAWPPSQRVYALVGLMPAPPR
ncbi:MAG TPA: zinc-ribbon domain-containing protein [Acetobacteraceae bacterium]|nr:zinc-ribbon domain-containing protein [Acetobacteraceae bacterium]